MSFKVFVVCASVLLVQGISGRCISAPPSCGCGSSYVSVGTVGCNSGISEIESISVSAPSIRVGNDCSGFSDNQRFSVSAPSVVVSGPALANSGGAFITTSIGPVAPSGIRVDNTNELYGDLLVSGALPYLSAVGFEGSFANSGVASVAYGCGDGEIAITEVIGSNNAALSATSRGTTVLSTPSCGCNRLY